MDMLFVIKRIYNVHRSPRNLVPKQSRQDEPKTYVVGRIHAQLYFYPQTLEQKIKPSGRCTEKKKKLDDANEGNCC